VEREWVQVLDQFGTPWMIALGNPAGFLAVRNYQWTIIGEAGLGLVAKNLEPYSTGVVACCSCPVHCHHRLKIKWKKDKEVYGEGPEYASIGSRGWKIGI
jgi:aldehyde:ferredoxin oxidoreductase